MFFEILIIGIIYMNIEESLLLIYCVMKRFICSLFMCIVYMCIYLEYFGFFLCGKFDVF